MSAIIMRSALVFWGQNPPPELHHIVDDGRTRRIVTWADVMAARREKQRKRLDMIRRVEEPRAHRLMVAYFDQDLMGGWHAFIEGIQGRNEYGTWINRDRSWLIPQLLREFPLVLPFGTEREQWQMWMPAFAQQFKRRTQHGHPVGVQLVWWDNRSHVVKSVGEWRGRDKTNSARTF